LKCRQKGGIMTIQEAIDILSAYGIEEAANGDVEICEALDIAIKSLKNEK